jgi:ribosomal protein L37AE/L43A
MTEPEPEAIRLRHSCPLCQSAVIKARDGFAMCMECDWEAVEASHPQQVNLALQQIWMELSR